MKWKKGVVVKEKKPNGYALLDRDREITIDEKYVGLMKAICAGLDQNNVLVTLIMKQEGVDESIAGLILAEFIIEYGDYIEENQDFFPISS